MTEPAIGRSTETVAGATRLVRILSLDGGGTWALIQARALQKLFGESAKGWDVLAGFDLVVANSGGSIVAGGLVANLELSKVIELLENEVIRRTIFDEKPFQWFRRHFPLPLPRYRTSSKRRGLADALGAPIQQRMADWKTTVLGAKDLADVVIVAFNYDSERATFFRTNGGSLAASGNPSTAASEATFLDAIHASSTPACNLL